MTDLYDLLAVCDRIVLFCLLSAANLVDKKEYIHCAYNKPKHAPEDIADYPQCCQLAVRHSSVDCSSQLRLQVGSPASNITRHIQYANQQTRTTNNSLCIARVGIYTVAISTSRIIKLCLRGAQTCALSLFCDRDFEINPMTFKLEGDRDILKMYPHAENEAASLRHSKLRAWIEKIRNMSRSKTRSKCQKLRITSSVIVVSQGQRSRSTVKSSISLLVLRPS